ncbi:aminotransferase [Seohaeicola zhoushanensis]|uniref:Hydroxylysine kinase n=2 Tax=Seohaeicola zhoushanensis TaxID=1569283 RepID=A0A8J3GVE4_9RHOB|nr:aminotransferase [Seohaeicola zhoushanensis]
MRPPPGFLPETPPDLLAHAALTISPEQAAEMADELFDVRGEVLRLNAEKDANFRITPEVGPPMLLKITNAAEDRGVTEMQTAALLHLARVDPGLPVPHVLPARNGAPSQLVSLSDGKAHVVRLLTFLDGTTLSSAGTASTLHYRIGALLARLTVGLQGFTHPASDHVLQWDIKQAHRLRPMLDAVEEPDLHRRLTRLIDQFEAEIAPRLTRLRAQVVHNDFNPHNLLVDTPAATRLTGVIDFGDMVHTPIACDLAVACSYHVQNGPQPLAAVARLIAGYATQLPLTDDEFALLPDLMRLRHATTLAVGAWRARRYPENASYIRRNAAASLRGLTTLDRMGNQAALAALQPEQIP